jgi:hypothetical protein
MFLLICLWNEWLGLSPSVLAGGTAGSPQLLTGPGQPPTETSESKDPEIPARYFPAGGRASPALGAMQEPIPDFIWFCSKLDNKSICSVKPENQTITMVTKKTTTALLISSVIT